MQGGEIIVFFLSLSLSIFSLSLSQSLHLSLHHIYIYFFFIYLSSFKDRVKHKIIKDEGQLRKGRGEYLERLENETRKNWMKLRINKMSIKNRNRGRIKTAEKGKPTKLNQKQKMKLKMVMKMRKNYHDRSHDDCHNDMSVCV